MADNMVDELYDEDVITSEELERLRKEAATAHKDSLNSKFQKLLDDDNLPMIIYEKTRFQEFMCTEQLVCEEFDSAYDDSIFLDNLTDSEQAYYDQNLEKSVAELVSLCDRLYELAERTRNLDKNSSTHKQAEFKYNLVRIARDEVQSVNQFGKRYLRKCNRYRALNDKVLYHIEGQETDKELLKKWPMAVPGWNKHTIEFLYEALLKGRYIDRKLTLTKFREAWYGGKPVEWVDLKTSFSVFITSLDVDKRKDIKKWEVIESVFSASKFDFKNLKASAGKKTKSKYRVTFTNLWKLALNEKEMKKYYCKKYD
ncbi:hypothetical protein [Endozoicomonas arenosclerae]|uniref:hypothetical protein n=1 Tax=Endozoicomonas arenosclerae TaxID=1633495 RepID=UPI00078078B5|nr:hypothetical protein [Endozoicomonas arenosclerae]